MHGDAALNEDIRRDAFPNSNLTGNANLLGSEIMNTRGGIHNSVTRAVVKPTHMIGGYAQLSYGFNYYGTVGSNRDEFVILRKMNKVDWMDDEASPAGENS